MLADRICEHGGGVALAAADLEHAGTYWDLPLVDERRSKRCLAQLLVGAQLVRSHQRRELAYLTAVTHPLSDTANHSRRAYRVSQARPRHHAGVSLPCPTWVSPM